MKRPSLLGLQPVENPLEVATKHYSTLGALLILALLFGYLGGAVLLGRDVDSLFVTFSVIGFVLLILLGKFTVQTDRWKKTRRTILTVALAWLAAFVWSDLAYAKAQMPTDAQLERAEASGFQAAVTELVISWEGSHMGDGVTCPRTMHQSYLDIVDVPTKGYGHTKTAKLGECLYEWQARDLLYSDIEDHWHPVWASFTRDGRAAMRPVTRRAGMASLCFNIGVRACLRSTAMRRFNRGDVRGGCQAKRRWNRAGGREVWGLVRRRTAEYEYCIWGLA